MKNILTQLLETLTSEEYKKVQKMAISPFFTTNKQIPILLNFLKKYFPHFQSTHLTKEKLYYKVFGVEKVIDPNYRKLISESSKLVRQFLIQQHNEQNEKRKSFDLLRIYQKRNILSEYKKLENKLKNEFENPLIVTPKHLKNNYELSMIRLSNLGANQQKERLDTLRNQFIDLENFYKISKQIILAELANFNNMTKDDGWELPKKDPQLFFIYQKLYNLTTTYNDQIFTEAKNLLDKNFDLLSFERKFEISQYLSNALIKEKFKYPKKYKKPLFDFYKYLVEKKLVIRNGKISHFAFINTINMACQNNELGWAEKFYNDYLNTLDEKLKKEASLMSKSLILFYKGDFFKAIELCNENNQVSESFNLFTRAIIIQSYFEISIKDDSYLTPLESSITSTKQWISRNTLMKEARKDMARKYLQTVGKIIKYISDPEKNKSTLRDLKTFVNSYPMIVQRIWLLDKIEELLKK